MPMSSEDLNVRTLDGGDVELDLSLLVTIPDESRICPGDPDFDGAPDSLFRVNRNLETAG
jgi:hypothetical protein